MFDLENLGGTFKGIQIIAECMFKLMNNKVIITKFFNKKKYLNVFSKYLNDEQKKFLEDNWYSIDGIEIKFEDQKKKIIFYEVKMKKAFLLKE